MKLPTRSHIANSPTPLDYLPRLTEHLAGPEIWIKRDDLTGIALGGNKIRKLEFFLAEANALGADTLITAGAIQSNHCRQTAAVAAKAGLDCLLILTDEEPRELSANNYLDTLLGAEIRWVGSQDREEALDETFRELTESGRTPYLVPYGGSNGLGACAYVNGLQELSEQRADPFDWIIFASSSGGTQAGMVLGLHQLGWHSKLLGISVEPPAQELIASVTQIVNECAQLIGVDIENAQDQIKVSDAYLGEGYAIMGPSEIEAIRLFAQQEAILVDPVYTGRAAAGMIDLIRERKITMGEKVLFWHTGGTPALFAPKYQSLLV